MAIGKKKRATRPRASAPSRASLSFELRAVPELDPFSGAAEHPDWVKRDFPAYAAAAHATGPVSSTRVLHAGGHEIEITTTYAVRIDGEPAPIHMMVDSDGRVWSHLCPYRTFPNASELLAYVIQHVPEALTNLGHGGHDHGGGEPSAPETTHAGHDEGARPTPKARPRARRAGGRS